MSNRWPGKYVIGLTGNIGTGKSVVRKMLEHLGAFGIDADALAHQATAKGGPAYTATVKLFGEWIVSPDGEINRARLSKIVFAEPDMLAKLEAIIHPMVGQAIEVLAKRSQASVIVIEAIKLLEAGLAKNCDAVWVVNVPEAVQLARLVEKRKMPEAEAKQRIAAQPPQADKIKAAQVVIENTGSFEDAWTQVQAAFSKIGQGGTPAPVATPVATTPAATAKPAATPAASAPAQPTTGAPAAIPAGAKGIKVRRGTPKDANQIAALVKTATNGERVLSRGDVIANFGDKAYMLTEVDGQLAALAGWKVENLVARVDEFYILANAPLPQLAPPMIEAVENAAKELQSEAALVFIPAALAQAATQSLSAHGFVLQTGDKLGVAAWKEAAKESQPAGTIMLFKKLREDRVLRPV